MENKKTVVLAQAFISLMMAFLMTGYANFLVFGPTMEWLRAWPKSFVTAWPVAFCLSLVVGRIGFGLAVKLTARRQA